MMQILIIGSFFLLWCLSSIVSVNVSSCARWNRTGTTVAGTGKSGNSSAEFNQPISIFILKKTNKLYVADSLNGRIQLFLLDQLSSSRSSVTVVLTEDQLERIYVEDDDDTGSTIYAALYGHTNHIRKWVRGSLSGIQIGETCSMCAGVSVDKEKNVYISDSGRQYVLKWSPLTNITTHIAGETDESGSTSERFSGPAGIHVDQITGSVYVTDTGNHRIQKWPKDATEGITVAGSRIMPQVEDSSSLKFPQSVLVDDETHVVYVADTYNNRIQRWLPAAFEGTTIAGGIRKGNASNQLSIPSSIAFDNKGNLYVCDTGNHRIQLFTIIDNRPCPSSSTATPQTTSTPSNHAVSSYWDQLYIETMTITTLLVVIRVNTMHV